MKSSELKELASIAKAIKRTEDYISEETALQGIAYDGIKSRSGSASRRTENEAAHIELACERIRALNRERTAILDRLKAEAEAVLNHTQRAVIIYRYADGLKFERIADITGYELSSVYKIHKKAVTLLTQNN